MSIREFLTKLQNLPDQHKKIILWSVVAVLAIAMGAFWIRGAMNSLDKIGQSVGQIKLPEISNNQLPIPNEILNDQNSETADWKTYINDEYGFEIKYPPEWNNNFDKDGNPVFCPDKDCIINTIYIYIYTPKGGTEILNYWRQQGNTYEEQEIKVDGITAIKREESYCVGAPLLTNGVFIEKTDYSLQLQGPISECGFAKEMQTTYDEAENVFNQMIYAFKFTK